LSNLEDLTDFCLINYYDSNARMGLGVDNDKKDFSYPVLSISIGNSALFRFREVKRSDKTKSIKLNNEDILMMQGKSRLIYYSVDKIYQSNLFDHRINLTLRKI
jgi:alkylated DNA repair protein (DNA oxidative demethylase)